MGTVGVPLLQAVSDAGDIAGGYAAFGEEGIEHFTHGPVVVGGYGAAEGESFEYDPVMTGGHACHREHDIAYADDITQNVFLQLWQTTKSFDSELHLKNWLMRVTVNQCKNFFRAPWRAHDNIDDYANTLGFEDQKSSDLFYLVMGMDKKYRTVLMLYYYEGYAIKEISSILAIPEKTVSTRLIRARNKLKSLLTEDV